MTNEEWIRSMNHEELAKFLYSLEESDFPWYDEFDKEICIPLCNRDTCLGLDCPYGDPIEWWLGKPMKKDCQELGLSHDFAYDFGINEFVCRKCGHVLTKEDKLSSLEYANALRRLEEKGGNYAEV